MSDDVKRRRRWKVTLYNPLSDRQELDRTGLCFGMKQAEGASMGRAFSRALAAAGETFLTVPYDYCGVAVSCYEAARAGMMRHPSQVGTRVSVLERGFTVEIERIR